MLGKAAMSPLPVLAGGLGQMLSGMGAADLVSLGHALVNLSACVRLDRFQGLQSGAVLEAAAHGLMQHNSFLASKCPVADHAHGVPGQRNPPPTDTSLPVPTHPSRGQHVPLPTCASCASKRSILSTQSRALPEEEVAVPGS